ncbi:ABC transporter permease [Burkholderia lata]|uniref:Membrane protein n=1 Tax=Burkholderia lata (strain ATCC 17760 / DSM 23089 / LMG 22485 / NCIMB 9086 / R18194 / 383) TaxID=482957 RepID=A0A6P2K873_BURL3|nr:ABC transporter permease [Burkholderia lata]VWB53390.1 membrane protein [Burkholderia lata]
MARRSASDATVPVNVTMPSSAIEIPADSRRASTSAVRVPTTHFVELAQRILYRGAGLDAVWIPFAVLFAIGCALFLLSLTRFRKTIGQMA